MACGQVGALRVRSERVTQLIAIASLSVIAVGIQLGNYWFTFGLWPQSWLSFVLFSLASIIVGMCMSSAIKGEK